MVGTLRWAWAQLTSMRTALLLLLLLAVAAVPGSIWPQRSVDSAAVDRYQQDHPELSRVLDALQMFDVYSSPWFAAIYLLLFTSLVGCIIPRTKVYLDGWRQQPPAVPRRTTRMPGHRVVDLPGADVDATAAEVAALGRSRRYRVREESRAEGVREVSMETGMLRELGNLVFHISLVGVLVSVALGYLFGWRAEVLVVEGEEFTSSNGRYDTLSAGPWVDTRDLPDFRLAVDEVDVDFETDPDAGKGQFGAPRRFEVDARFDDGDGERAQKFTVNAPLSVGGARIYLLGNGYAPEVSVRDAKGTLLYREASPMLVQDNQYTSSGAFKVSAGEDGKQLGLAGLFLPTQAITGDRGPHSTFPGLADPALVMTAWQGELFPGGRPQSVFTLNTDRMKQVQGKDGTPVRIFLRPGEEYELPGGRGTVTFEGVRRFAGLTVRHDPGQVPALVSALTGLVGLVMTLTIRRRRYFVRIVPGEGGARVEMAGLAKGHDPTVAEGVDALHTQLTQRLGTARAQDEEN
ncbi:cytochrome c biogenesis protein ResB [Kytococcus sp. HMSC28H12]|uniref:cytochrome c biogenesis protein ResB n=1 Tax=Kytococcus sp. HMSC28H12 TaxID=1581067 RepID=UPI0008A212A3|nr:cytochrome c biogenesis protein ResB [Kytococcus sp. HMSC28H12]